MKKPKSPNAHMSDIKKAASAGPKGLAASNKAEMKRSNERVKKAKSEWPGTA